MLTATRSQPLGFPPSKCWWNVHDPKASVRFTPWIRPGTRVLRVIDLGNDNFDCPCMLKKPCRHIAAVKRAIKEGR